MVWTEESILIAANKCRTKSDFEKSYSGAFKAAKRLNILQNITFKVPVKDMNKWNEETIKQEALKYNSRSEFKKNCNGAMKAAKNLGILEQVCSHMEILWEKKWDLENIKQEALKYNSRSEFKKNCNGAMKAAKNLGILEQVCQHMEILRKDWSNIEDIKQEALKYKTRKEFKKNCNGAMKAAKKLGILDQVCSHMEKSNNISIPEQNLFDIIKQKYPKTQKLRDRKVKIPNKSYIEHLEIDIYIPELRKGIEFDGKYWHSIEGLKRSHPNWEEEDLINYHQIKDKYFLSKKIKILHIKEQDWLKDRESCIKNCLEFLSKGH